MKPTYASVYGIFAGAVVSASVMMAYWSMQGQYAFVEQAKVFPSSSPVAPTIGDGSNEWGGTPPAYLKEPADIPSNYPTTTLYNSTTTFPGVPGEAKFRTVCDFAFNAKVDPILYPGRPDLGHMHTFMGNTKVDQNSNYFSLRTTGESTCGGGKLNRSAYWFPSVMKDDATGDGRTKIKIPNYAIVYYTRSIADSSADMLVRIPRGLGYVFGFNPADPTDTYSNDPFIGQSATGRWAAQVAGQNGFNGWSCESGTGGFKRYLRDNTGAATLACASDDPLYASLKGPACWDGVNLMSPNGRKHMFSGARHLDSAFTAPKCPNGWYHIPIFEMKIFYTHEGASDFKEWYLESDRMTDAQFEYAAGDCHASNITNGIPGSYCNGETMHTDWFGAWDYDAMSTWMRLCNGIDQDTGTDNNHDCDSSEIGDGRKMEVNSFVDASSLAAADSWIDLPQQP